MTALARLRAASERATSAVSRAIAHRLGWHATACRGRRECGPPIDGAVHGHEDHPWLPWLRWT